MIGLLAVSASVESLPPDPEPDGPLTADHVLRDHDRVRIIKKRGLRRRPDGRHGLIIHQEVGEHTGKILYYVMVPPNREIEIFFKEELSYDPW